MSCTTSLAQASLTPVYTWPWAGSGGTGGELGVPAGSKFSIQPSVTYGGCDVGAAPLSMSVALGMFHLQHPREETLKTS